MPWSTVALLAALLLPGCVGGTKSETTTDEEPTPTDPGVDSSDTGTRTGWTSYADDSGYRDTGEPFVAPDCTAELPETAVVGCSLTPDAGAVAECAATGSAALIGAVGYPALADALSSAVAGDVVTVCPGTWAGPFEVDREIVLEAADPTPGLTVLEGGTAVLTLASPATVIGLTIRGGRTGVSAEADDVVIECSEVSDNTRAGIEATGADLVIRTSTIADNSGDGGLVAATVTVEDTVFRGNYAGYGGGGAALGGGDATFTRTLFDHNVADYEGGALTWGDRDPHTLTLTDSVFHCNASGYEGAVVVGSWGDDTLNVERCTFDWNYAGYEGGAMSLGSWGSIDAVIDDSSFAFNFADYGGGALQIGGWLDNGGWVTFSGVSFTDNASGSSGGMFGVSTNAPRVEVVGVDLTVLRNAGSTGAVDATAQTTFDCTNCDFGAGADDNIPHDAEKDGVVTATLPLNFTL